jgi:hypothetical protein
VNFHDYDGNFRKKFVGIVKTDRGWGDDTSIQFLTSYDPPFRSSKTGIVMCTGTEYSEFLEMQGANVLTATKKEFEAFGESMLIRNLRPIK